MKRVLLVLLLSLVFTPAVLFAQLDTSNLILQGGNSTSIVLNPTNPGPNEQVTARLESYEVNLDTSSIVWSVDGTVVKSGVGEKTITLFTGAVGTTKTIKVSISGSGKNFSKSLTIKIGQVDILWQGRGYVSPFYKGRNLWAKQGFIVLVAIPSLTSTGETNINNLIYKWSRNDEILGGDSGRGKNYLVFQDSILNLPKTISVEVFNGNTLVASNSINISARDPKVLVYENNPLLGYMFNYESSSGYVLTKPEVTFASFPFYFSANLKNDSSLSFNWSSNQTSNLESSDEIVFRVPENTQGKAYISSAVKSNTQLLQGGSKDFLVQFGKDNGF